MLLAKYKGDINKHNAHVNRLLREIAQLKNELKSVTQQRDMLEERITALLRGRDNVNG